MISKSISSIFKLFPGFPLHRCLFLFPGFRGPLMRFMSWITDLEPVVLVQEGDGEDQNVADDTEDKHTFTVLVIMNRAFYLIVNKNRRISNNIV